MPTVSILSQCIALMLHRTDKMKDVYVPLDVTESSIMAVLVVFSVATVNANCCVNGFLACDSLISMFCSVCGNLCVVMGKFSQQVTSECE